MWITFEDGSSVKTSTEDQERILSNIEREFLVEARSSRQKTSTKKTGYPHWYGSSFSGLQESDFNDEVTGTHWRCREQLGGAVTARIKSEKRYNSWSVYGRPEVHWAEVKHRGQERAHVQSKFWVKVNSASLSFGFYIERSNQDNAPRKDWNQFLDWLREPQNASHLHQLMTTQGLSIWDPYFPGYSPSLEVKIQPCPEGFIIQSATTQRIDVMEIADTLEQIAQEHPDIWLDILVGVEMPKAEVVAAKSEIAGKIADLFNRLRPIYENSTV